MDNKRPTFDEIRDQLEKFWNDIIPDNRTKYDGVLHIYDGWSSDDVSDPKRYRVESYKIGTLMTGRGGMKNMIDNGVPITKVFYNGVEIPLSDFYAEFERITKE